MFRFIDESSFLSRILDNLSSGTAQRRGLPILIGIVLFIVGFVIQLVNFFLEVPALELIAILLNGVGLITALIGILLSAPLGGE